MSKRSDGNVGIGTTNPLYKIHVSGDINYTGNLLKNGTNVLQYLDVSSGIQGLLNAKQNTLTAGTNINIANNTISSTATSQWTTSGTTIYYNGGNVGIGTISPTQLLHIQKAGANNWIKIDAGSSSSLTCGILFAEHNIDWGFDIRFNAGTDKLHFSHQTNTTTFTDIMTMTTSGNVGIGTDNPLYKLKVNGSFRLSNGFSQHPDGTFALDKPNIVGGRVMCLTNGNFGINKSAPAYTLDVGGDINITGTLRKDCVDILAVSKLVNQHYISSTFYVGADTLRTYSINVSPLASFGNNTARIYDLNISGINADYGLSTEVIGSYRIFHSNFAGEKLKKITLFEQSPASAPLNVNISNGSIVTFNTVNLLQGDIYTSVSIVN